MVWTLLSIRTENLKGLSSDQDHIHIQVADGRLFGVGCRVCPETISAVIWCYISKTGNELVEKC